MEYTELLPRIKDEIVVACGRTDRWMASLWNKEEFILLPVGHCLLYLVTITEHHLARIQTEYRIIRVRLLVKQILSKCIYCCKMQRKTSANS